MIERKQNPIAQRQDSASPLVETMKAQQAITEALSAMIKTAIDKAKDGSVPHLRLLLEFAGLYPAPPPAPPEDAGNQVAQELLRRLEIPPERSC